MSVIPFYDILEATPLDDDPSLVEVERVYRLDMNAFSDAQWSALREIYRSLPGAYRERQISAWFGDDEEHPPFLCASVEPSGLQVYGILALESWIAWDAAFVAALATSALPFRAVG
jgi:hypothetical protein